MSLSDLEELRWITRHRLSDAGSAERIAQGYAAKMARIRDEVRAMTSEHKRHQAIRRAAGSMTLEQCRQMVLLLEVAKHAPPHNSDLR